MVKFDTEIEHLRRESGVDDQLSSLQSKIDKAKDKSSRA